MASNTSPRERIVRAFETPGFDVELEFEITGRIYSQRSNDLHEAARSLSELAVMGFAHVDLKFLDTSEVPSELVELVVAHDKARGSFVTYAVTERAMTKFAREELEGAAGKFSGADLYRDLRSHYSFHHDWEVYERNSREARENPLRATPHIPSCRCPLILLHAVGQHPGTLPRDAGLEPVSVIECADSGVRIEGVGRARRKLLEAISARLKSDIGISTD